MNKHPDILDILIAATGGMWALFLDIELILKVCIGIVTLSYIIWKWRVEYLKNKNS